MVQSLSGARATQVATSVSELPQPQLKIDRFPFPSKGDITLRARNTNYTAGASNVAHRHEAGAVIPAHLHKGMAEALYIVEGDFTNEGKQYRTNTRSLDLSALCHKAEVSRWDRTCRFARRKPTLLGERVMSGPDP